jgi:uncharacterized protein (TIGR02246 family)
MAAILGTNRNRSLRLIVHVNRSESLRKADATKEDIDMAPIHAAGDVTQIQEVVAATQTLQNDVDGFTALLTDDAAIVNVAGRWVQGRKDIRAAMERALATPLGDVQTTIEVDDVRFLRPDVALVTATKRITDQREDQTTALPSTGRVTFALVEEDGRWLLALAHTTPVIT